MIDSCDTSFAMSMTAQPKRSEPEMDFAKQKGVDNIQPQL